MRGCNTISSTSPLVVSPKPLLFSDYPTSLQSVIPSQLHLLPSRLTPLTALASPHLLLPYKVKSPLHMAPSCPNSFHSIPPWSPPSPTVSPPTSSQIRRRSQAGRAGLRERDQLLAINGVSCTSFSHASAMSLIDASGNQLVLTVRRYGPVPPQPTPNPLVQGFHCLFQLCVSLTWLQLLTSIHFCLSICAGV